MKTIILVIAIPFAVFSCKEDIVTDKNNGRGVTTNIPATAISDLETPQDLDVLINEIGNARYVLLGEASHGTSEFYTWRAEISRKLIQEKGFNIIGVEGDWPDLYRFNQYIGGSANSGANAREVLQQLDRWPTWMWANEEVAEFGEWLQEHNQTNPGNQVSFYGLDVYSLWDSMEEVLNYLATTDPTSVPLAESAINCFAPYQGDGFAYGQAAAYGNANCADELAALLTALEGRVTNNSQDEALFSAIQNALVAVNAEKYYSTAVRSNAESWNVRDRHMAATAERLTNFHGENSKIIIWEHNTHVGDARATDMAADGMVNIGQLIREDHRDEGVYIVGFGTYQGSVIASSSWGARMQEMQVPAAVEGSWEAILHEIEPANKLIFMKELQDNEELLKPKGHRAIGVVYDPLSERGNYVPTVLPKRYDVFIFFDRTEGLHPLNTATGRKISRGIQTK